MKLTKSATEEVDATLTRLARGQEERRGEKRREEERRGEKRREEDTRTGKGRE
jgi:hypothetical protein